MKGHLVRSVSKASAVRYGVEKTFDDEITLVEDFIHRRPFFSMAFALLLGVVLGGLLSASVSQYILFALVGGFPIAMLYGNGLGISPEFSVVFVIFLDLLVIYVLMRSLYFFSHYPKLTPYFDGVRNRYEYSVEALPRALNRLPLVLFIALIGFLVGPWITTIIAYLSMVNLKTTVTGIGIGLSGAGVISLAIYRDLLGSIPNPFLVTAITLAIIFAVTTVINKVLNQKKSSSETSAA
ncbi:MAG: hypothetical protein M1503_12190 [Thaumarchaeota archaeon]|nr:hypothetical protein [Nitrososphaerota archaeon]